MSECHVIGIDLSGPANASDTVVTCFLCRTDHLEHMATIHGADDTLIGESVDSLITGGDLVVGLDAPLSYNPGGGDRAADKELRRLLIAAGLPPGTVLVPTMTRMAYLTLRGVVVARLLQQIQPLVRLAEVHPGGCLVLRGAPPRDVASLKRDPEARVRLASWLGEHGLRSLPADAARDDHGIAGYAAALAAWQWSLGRSVWCRPASMPFHPFDLAC